MILVGICLVENWGFPFLKFETKKKKIFLGGFPGLIVSRERAPLCRGKFWGLERGNQTNRLQLNSKFSKPLWGWGGCPFPKNIKTRVGFFFFPLGLLSQPLFWVINQNKKGGPPFIKPRSPFPPPPIPPPPPAYKKGAPTPSSLPTAPPPFLRGFCPSLRPGVQLRAPPGGGDLRPGSPPAAPSSPPPFLPGKENFPRGLVGALSFLSREPPSRPGVSSLLGLFLGFSSPFPTPSPIFPKSWARAPGPRLPPVFGVCKNKSFPSS